MDTSAGDQVEQSTSPVSMPAQLASPSVTHPASPTTSPPQHPDAHGRANMTFESTDILDDVVAEINGQEETIGLSCDQDQVRTRLKDNCDPGQAKETTARLQEQICATALTNQEVQSRKTQLVEGNLVTCKSATESTPVCIESCNGKREENDSTEASNGNLEDRACDDLQRKSNNIEYLLNSNNVCSVVDLNSSNLKNQEQSDCCKEGNLQFSKKLGIDVPNGHVCMESNVNFNVEAVTSSTLLGKLQDNSKNLEEGGTLIESHDRSDGSDSGLGSESAETLFSNSADEPCPGTASGGKIFNVDNQGEEAVPCSEVKQTDHPEPSSELSIQSSTKSEERESVIENDHLIDFDYQQSVGVKESIECSSSLRAAESNVTEITESLETAVHYREGFGSEIVSGTSQSESHSCKAIGITDHSNLPEHSRNACIELSEYPVVPDVKFETAVRDFACESLRSELKAGNKSNGIGIANSVRPLASLAMPTDCIVETETLNDDNIPTFDDLRTPPGETETRTSLEDEEDDIPLQTPTLTLAPILSDFSMKGRGATIDQEDSVSSMVCGGADSVVTGFSLTHGQPESVTVSDDQSCMSRLANEALPGTSKEPMHASMSSSECSSDSNEADRRRSTLKRPASSACDGESQPKRKKSIAFDSVSVYYFPRTQGFTCVPSQVYFVLMNLMNGRINE